jgi:cytochrome c peroxidase
MNRQRRRSGNPCRRLRLALVVVMLSFACGGAPDGPESTRVTAAELSLFAPLPVSLATRSGVTSGAALEARIALGRALFHEPRLSDGHDVSCSTCHALNGWGADGRRVSYGHDGRAGSRNAPTVYNAAGHFVQFWDGRARDVEEQAMGPILNPIEMGMQSSEAVLRHLRASPSYVRAFRAAFPDESRPITYDNVGRAIGAFERGLLTPGRWDRFLDGDTTALTLAEQGGLKTFVAVGCAGCHAGAFVGGDRYALAGVVRPWPTSADSGRYQVTGLVEDLFVFKVPSLRNVAMTSPYFHDGSVTSLAEAVRMMAHHQLGRTLTAPETQGIVAYLEALTGNLPAKFIAFPQGER